MYLIICLLICVNDYLYICSFVYYILNKYMCVYVINVYVYVFKFESFIYVWVYLKWMELG